MLDHPFLHAPDRFFADRAGTQASPQLERLFGQQEEITPGEELCAVKFQWRAGHEKLIQIESGRCRTARIHRMQHRKRHHDGARPGGHLIDEIPEQDQFGRNGRRMLARKQPEKAQIDLHVAVSGLQAAQLENALPRASQPRVVECQACELERCISLDCRVQLARTGRVNVESTIGKLPVQSRTNCLVDKRPRRWIPCAAGRWMQPQLQ